MEKRKRQVLLEIWCSPEARDKFRLLYVRGRFRNYGAFLNWLLERAEAEWTVEKVCLKAFCFGAITTTVDISSSTRKKY
jgi:hypothetical protein